MNEPAFPNKIFLHKLVIDIPDFAKSDGIAPGVLNSLFHSFDNGSNKIGMTSLLSNQETICSETILS